MNHQIRAAAHAVANNPDQPLIVPGASWMAVLAVMLAGCTNIPTMEYCQHVQYTRTGNIIHVEADCAAPVGVGVPAVPKL